MNQEQFKAEFGRLEKEWPKSYGPSKAQRFADNFSGMDAVHFRKIVDRALDSFRQAPTVNDLWGINSDVLKENWEMLKNESPIRIATQVQEEGYESDLTMEENQRRLNTVISWLERSAKDPSLSVKELTAAIWPERE